MKRKRSNTQRMSSAAKHTTEFTTTDSKLTVDKASFGTVTCHVKGKLYTIDAADLLDRLYDKNKHLAQTYTVGEILTKVLALYLPTTAKYALYGTSYFGAIEEVEIFKAESIDIIEKHGICPASVGDS